MKKALRLTVFLFLITNALASGIVESCKPCVFPFIYQGIHYTNCTTDNYNGIEWCATTNNYDSDRRWKNCTGLQVLMSPATVIEGARVTLTCSNECKQSGNFTYAWYKNSQPITNNHTATGNTLRINSATPEYSGHYSCAVEGSRSSPARALTIRYGPRNTLASVHPSGPTMEGSSVILTCSSDANPPAHTYSWYKKCGNQPSLAGSGQSYSLPNVSSEESGQYHCVAENDLGRGTSSVVKINVIGANHQSDWILPAAVIGGSLAGFVVGALVGALAYKRMAKTRKDRKSPTADPQVRAENSDDIYMDPDLDIPTSDDYANLNTVQISNQGVKYNSGESPTPAEAYVNFR